MIDKQGIPMNYCLVCHAENMTLIYKDTLLRCNLCGFTTANLEITEEELSSVYNSDYFRGAEYLDYLTDKSVLRKNFLQRLKNLQINELTNINALEIGSAYGFFGELFIKQYKNASYTGIDVVREAVEFGKYNYNLDFFCQDYLKFENSKDYSHVFMWDVIEHLSRPDLYIKKIAEESLVGAELHITTGDIDAFLPSIRKENWRMIHPPTHLHYFSKNSLSLLLQKNGYKIKAVRYPPVYRSIKQIYYSLFLLNKVENKTLKWLLEKIPEKWFVPVNTYDIMHCIAVKER